jgi:hypothetical protein
MLEMPGGFTYPEDHHGPLVGEMGRDRPRLGDTEVGLPEHVGAASLLGRAQRPHEIGAERSGDLRLQPFGWQPARHAAGELTDEEAVGVRVIAVPCARRPPGFGRRDGAGHRVPAPQRVVPERRTDRRYAGSVTERVAHGRAPLPGEQLGPPRRRGLVELELAARDELQYRERNNRLADGVRVDERVGLPGTFARCVGPAAPQVDDGAPVDRDRAGGADLAVVEVADERIAHRLEPCVDPSPDHCRSTRSLPRRRHGCIVTVDVHVAQHIGARVRM